MLRARFPLAIRCTDHFVNFKSPYIVAAFDRRLYTRERANERARGIMGYSHKNFLRFSLSRRCTNESRRRDNRRRGENSRKTWRKTGGIDSFSSARALNVCSGEKGKRHRNAKRRRERATNGAKKKERRKEGKMLFPPALFPRSPPLVTPPSFPGLPFERKENCERERERDATLEARRR